MSWKQLAAFSRQNVPDEALEKVRRYTISGAIMRNADVAFLRLLSFTAEEAKQLIDISNTAVDDKDGVSSEDEETPQISTLSSVLQTPRTFWTSQEDSGELQYEINALLSCETGGVPGCLQRTTEFKRLTCRLNDLEKPFIDRVKVFVIACLNARINGTIYLGVTDSGQIVGLPCSVLFRPTKNSGIYGEEPQWHRSNIVLESSPGYGESSEKLRPGTNFYSCKR
jgi:hypothetical protein